MGRILLSLPPRIKVLEALGCVADRRINFLKENYAKVVSSLGDRVYDVYVDVNRGVAYSSDNGTTYRNYIGYPIISFLMMKGLLPFNGKIAEALKGIPWKSLNERYRKYALVEREIFMMLKERGISRGEVLAFVKIVMEKLKAIKLFKLESLPLEVY
ncbi:MAG: hypothetical protein NDF56_07965 [archaeon GB-1845-036]|nr:hypothetical protein [Candidatus Culexmicrobium thermophilum]